MFGFQKVLLTMPGTKKNFVIIVAAALVFLPLRLSAQMGMGMQSSHPSSHAAAPAPSAKPPQTPVARVNGVTLTQAQLDQELRRLFPYYSIHGGHLPAGAEDDLNKKAMHDLVLHELLYQEALSRKLTIPPAVWQQRLRTMRQRFPTRAAYDARATKEYGSVAEFERLLRRSMLVEQLWDTDVTKKTAVGPQAAKDYYLAHKEHYVRPEAVWLQTITVKFPANATPEQKQEARKLAEQILVKVKAANSYEEFGVLAEKLSQDEWRVMMGDHNWVHRGAVTPDIEPALFSMKAGQISGIVESSNGYLILRANQCQPKRQMTYTEVGASVHQHMVAEKKEKLSQGLETRLRAKFKVEIL